MITKCSIVQNVDLTAWKIIDLWSTEQAMQAEANSNNTANVTLPLYLRFIIFPSGLRDCTLSFISSAHKQVPDHWEHSHWYSDALVQCSWQATSGG